MTMPNFFIIGAMKAGTTSLWEYLNQHPEIYMSPVKEPNYFIFRGEEFNWETPEKEGAFHEHLRGLKKVGFVVTDGEEYEGLFRGVKGEKAIGEASISYLQSAKAAKEIKKDIPAAKLIAILRDPVERAYSQYRQLVRTGSEICSSFEGAIRREENGLRPRMCLGWQNIKASSFYAEPLNRYFKLFLREQIKIILFEDIKKDAGQVSRSIFDFLGVDSGFVPDKEEAANADLEDKSNPEKLNIIDEPSHTPKEYRRLWAQRIQKVYEVDPLICEKCGGEMRIISFIQERTVIMKILNHLGIQEKHAHSPPEKEVQTLDIVTEPYYDDLPIDETL